jgi:hypothetical protein
LPSLKEYQYCLKIEIPASSDLWLHNATGCRKSLVLLNLGESGGFDITPWADRVPLVDAEYLGTWELPAIEAVTAPTASLVRPDGYGLGGRPKPVGAR